MKKTKIICSIGPASESFEVMSKLVLNGMNCARINLSHASNYECNKIINTVRKVRKETGKYVAIMYDTKGPEFRTSNFEDDGIYIKEGETIKLVKEDCLGNKEKFSVNHKDAIDYIKKGSHVLIDNALLDSIVVEKNRNYVRLKALNDGEIKSHKTINVPGVDLNLPFISKEDRCDIEFAARHSCDYLALSFVNCANDVKKARKIIINNGGDAKIISKIESQMGMENIDEIIDESDGIMVARGDLGVEIPMEMLPLAQKEIIRKCREKGKFAIVATEMLASMYTNPRPTRAEVSDIANAVLDGTDCVMLSGETTVGKYPVDSVKYMSSICKETESTIDYTKHFKYNGIIDISDTIAKLVVDSTIYNDIKLIVTTTMTGYTAQKISNFRPNCTILACCPSSHIAEKVALNFGVIPIVTKIHKTTDDIVSYAIDVATREFNLKKGDLIAFTGGFPIGKAKSTNFIRIVEI